MINMRDCEYVNAGKEKIDGVIKFARIVKYNAGNADCESSCQSYEKQQISTIAKQIIYGLNANWGKSGGMNKTIAIEKEFKNNDELTGTEILASTNETKQCNSTEDNVKPSSVKLDENANRENAIWVIDLQSTIPSVNIDSSFENGTGVKDLKITQANHCDIEHCDITKNTQDVENPTESENKNVNEIDNEIDNGFYNKIDNKIDNGFYNEIDNESDNENDSEIDNESGDGIIFQCDNNDSDEIFSSTNSDNVKSIVTDTLLQIPSPTQLPTPFYPPLPPPELAEEGHEIFTIYEEEEEEDNDDTFRGDMCESNDQIRHQFENHVSKHISGIQDYTDKIAIESPACDKGTFSLVISVEEDEFQTPPPSKGRAVNRNVYYSAMRKSNAKKVCGSVECNEMMIAEENVSLENVQAEETTLDGGVDGHASFRKIVMNSENVMAKENVSLENVQISAKETTSDGSIDEHASCRKIVDSENVMAEDNIADKNILVIDGSEQLRNESAVPVIAFLAQNEIENTLHHKRTNKPRILARISVTGDKNNESTGNIDLQTPPTTSTPPSTPTTIDGHQNQQSPINSLVKEYLQMPLTHSLYFSPEFKKTKDFDVDVDYSSSDENDHHNTPVSPVNVFKFRMLSLKLKRNILGAECNAEVSTSLIEEDNDDPRIKLQFNSDDCTELGKEIKQHFAANQPEMQYPELDPDEDEQSLVCRKIQDETIIGDKTSCNVAYPEKQQNSTCQNKFQDNKNETTSSSHPKIRDSPTGNTECFSALSAEQVGGFPKAEQNDSFTEESAGENVDIDLNNNFHQSIEVDEDCCFIDENQNILYSLNTNCVKQCDQENEITKQADRMIEKSVPQKSFEVHYQPTLTKDIVKEMTIAKHPKIEESVSPKLPEVHKHKQVIVAAENHIVQYETMVDSKDLTNMTCSEETDKCEICLDSDDLTKPLHTLPDLKNEQIISKIEEQPQQTALEHVIIDCIEKHIQNNVYEDNSLIAALDTKISNASLTNKDTTITRLDPDILEVEANVNQDNLLTALDSKITLDALPSAAEANVVDNADTFTAAGADPHILKMEANEISTENFSKIDSNHNTSLHETQSTRQEVTIIPKTKVTSLNTVEVFSEKGQIKTDREQSNETMLNCKLTGDAILSEEVQTDAIDQYRKTTAIYELDADAISKEDNQELEDSGVWEQIDVTVVETDSIKELIDSTLDVQTTNLLNEKLPNDANKETHSIKELSDSVIEAQTTQSNEKLRDYVDQEKQSNMELSDKGMKNTTLNYKNIIDDGGDRTNETNFAGSLPPSESYEVLGGNTIDLIVGVTTTNKRKKAEVESERKYVRTNTENSTENKNEILNTDHQRRTQQQIRYGEEEETSEGKLLVTKVTNEPYFVQFDFGTF